MEDGKDSLGDASAAAWELQGLGTAGM